MVVTFASIVCAIAIVVGVGAVLAGSFFQQPATVASAPVASATVEAPATATAQTDLSAQPAPVSASAPSSAPAVVAPSQPAAVAAAPAPSPATALGVVVIDAGHQQNGTPNTKQEPVGPGASQTKDSVEGGASSPRHSESSVNLAVALKLQKVLVARGVTVVMVRTTENVDIPNSKRAEIANSHHADLFVRLHCDSGGSSTHGFLMLIPGSNKWTKPIYAQSKIAGRDVLSAALVSTGAYDRGTTERNDLTGFNYAKVPAILAEMGVMSNKAEDIKLSTASYQQKLADGMANGIVQYLKSR
jgi:N-acetylmuramoyl-L-alanine amidase